MDPQPGSWAEIDRLIVVGNKIGAIKEFREQTGSGLKEAKDAVEAREIQVKSGHVSSSAESFVGSSSKGAMLLTDSSHWGEIDPLIYSGRKILAIKAYRQRTGLGLKEAKEAVEAREIDLRLRSPNSFTAPEKSGCLPTVFLFLAVIQIVYWVV